jgi:hypothetical protein
VSERGIEANPEKITTINRMGPIHNVKWGMPLYKLLKKSNTFILTEEAQQPLENLKTLLTSVPVLVTPER